MCTYTYMFILYIYIYYIYIHIYSIRIYITPKCSLEQIMALSLIRGKGLQYGNSQLRFLSNISAMKVIIMYIYLYIANSIHCCFLDKFLYFNFTQEIAKMEKFGFQHRRKENGRNPFFFIVIFKL